MLRRHMTEDLDRAIVANEQSELIPVDYPNHPIYLKILGNALQRRFKWISDLHHAIVTEEQSDESNPVDHLNHPI